MFANYNAGHEIVINETHLLSKSNENEHDPVVSDNFNADHFLYSSYPKISYHNPPNFYDDWYLIFPQLSILLNNLNVLVEDYKQIRNVSRNNISIPF